MVRSRPISGTSKAACRMLIPSERIRTTGSSNSSCLNMEIESRPRAVGMPGIRIRNFQSILIGTPSTDGWQREEIQNICA